MFRSEGEAEGGGEEMNIIVTGIVAAAVLLWLVIAGAKERSETVEKEEMRKDTISGRNASSGNPRGVREGDRK